MVERVSKVFGIERVRGVERLFSQDKIYRVQATFHVLNGKSEESDLLDLDLLVFTEKRVVTQNRVTCLLTPRIRGRLYEIVEEWLFEQGDQSGSGG